MTIKKVFFGKLQKHVLFLIAFIISQCIPQSRGTCLLLLANDLMGPEMITILGVFLMLTTLLSNFGQLFNSNVSVLIFFTTKWPNSNHFCKSGAYVHLWVAILAQTVN
jgi:hypothetical protein